MEDKDLDEYLKESYNFKLETTIQKAIKMTYPEISNLQIVMGEKGIIQITFDDDGIHTKDMIEALLQKLIKWRY
jgi:hypothetical protein